MSKKPFIISILGNDGSGKFTQATMLKEKLEKDNKKVKMISFPNYESDIGKSIKRDLMTKANSEDMRDLILLINKFAMDRVITLENINMEDYDFIIFDRYTSSNVLHMGAKIINLNKDKSKLDEELISCITYILDKEHKDLSLPIPDLEFFLEVRPEVSYQNILNRYEGDMSKLDLNESLESLKSVTENQMAILGKMLNYFTNKSQIYNLSFISCSDRENMFSKDKIHDKIVNYLDWQYKRMKWVSGYDK